MRESLDELGLHAPYDEVHHLEEEVHEALGAAGGTGAWLTNTAASAVLGFVVGALVVAVMHRLGGAHQTSWTAADPAPGGDELGDAGGVGRQGNPQALVRRGIGGARPAS